MCLPGVVIVCFTQSRSIIFFTMEPVRFAQTFFVQSYDIIFFFEVFFLRYVPETQHILNRECF